MLNAQRERCCWGRDPKKHLRILARARVFVSVYQSINAILVGSDYMRRLLVRGGIPADAIGILPPVLVRSPQPPVRYPEDSRTILFAGRLVSEKGLHLLIQALALVNGEWELIVAGEGKDRARCEALCAELGLGDRVHFVGWLSQMEMAASYEACAFVVVPSLWPEPFGRIGPEAFIRGRPVVAFDTGGIPDWLEHGTDGYLAPAGDIGQLAGGIQKLLDAPGLRKEMGRRAREKALAAWDASTHISHLEGIFEEAVVRY
jgi:glycosyltransferase involved in cell wall biosynthesis